MSPHAIPPRHLSGDIVVLGAGLIGLAIAYELAKRGAEVRVFDAGEPGRGASWAGAGMLAPYTEELEDGPLLALCAFSLERYPAFADELRERTGVDVHLRRDGILDVAFDAGERERLAARTAPVRERGGRARMVDQRELRRLEPALADAAVGALLSETEGQVDNRRLGRALFAACRALGVRVHPNTPALGLATTARCVLGVHIESGFVAAPVVVNALGAWAAELGGVPGSLRLPVTPVKGQMLALAVSTGLLRRTIWAPGVYLVPRHDGRLLVGATVEHAGHDVRVTAQGVHSLLAGALRAVPALRDAALTETWAGLRPGSLDGRPYLGATSLGGYFVASGHYRNGILMTPATAILLADAIEGATPAVDLAPFAIERSASRSRVPTMTAG